MKVYLFVIKTTDNGSSFIEDTRERKKKKVSDIIKGFKQNKATRKWNKNNNNELARTKKNPTLF